MIAKRAHCLMSIFAPSLTSSSFRNSLTVRFLSAVARSYSSSTSRFSNFLMAPLATPCSIFSFAFSFIPSLIVLRAYSRASSSTWSLSLWGSSDLSINDGFIAAVCMARVDAISVTGSRRSGLLLSRRKSTPILPIPGSP